MIAVFESMARMYPDRVCFTFAEENGGVEQYTYRETRFMAAGIANALRKEGLSAGDSLVVDLPNCPEFVFLILAAAYGSFSLAAVNNRLTASEKMVRILELERTRQVRVGARFDRKRARSLVSSIKADLSGIGSRRGAKRVIMGAQRDAEEEIIHFAERAAHLFDSEARALVMFTSGTTGKPKAVSLSWRQLLGSAQASNEALSCDEGSLWQAALPLFHVGGFQVVVRSLLSRKSFMLYARFDAHRLLSDAARYGVTHVSVVDKMLQDLLEADSSGALQGYECILLGGGALNGKTLARACAAHARVYASYGMTETASNIANELVTASFDGGISLMSGYKARIVDPDEESYGRLAVKGPGVFEGYLNARAAFTVDGYFLTGDTAALRNGRLYVKERTDDMFVSGGENVYPAEIADKLMSLPGVSDAYVFGVPDAKWGRRPVAFVERQGSSHTPAPLAKKPSDSGALRLLGHVSNGANGGAGAATASENATAEEGRVAKQLGSQEQDPVSAAERKPLTSATVTHDLKGKLSKLYLPKHVCVVDELPRSGIGKIDRAAVERLYEQRIEIKKVALHHVRLPFKTPFKTAKATLHYRDSIIVEVTDRCGRTGLGECVAFSSNWYLPETLGQDAMVLQHALAPLVLNEVYAHPREVSASFGVIPEIEMFSMARGALEPALWDLYGKIVGKPLWQLLNEELGESIRGTKSVQVSAGAVVGLGSPQDTVDAVSRCVQAGYRRVKLKVAPGSLSAVRAVRAAFPRLVITLDANQSFTERNMMELQALDKLDIAWIEEPFAMQGRTGDAAWDRLAQLQRYMATPLCIDESAASVQDAYQALSHSELRCFAVKVGKFGGVKPTIDFVKEALRSGVTLWMGGMYDTGISKRMHAAFQTVPKMMAAGDVGATSRYFDADITMPPYTVKQGLVTLNGEGCEHGLGCTLHIPTLRSVLIKTTVIE